MLAENQPWSSQACFEGSGLRQQIFSPSEQSFSLNLKESIRFKNTDFVTAVLEAVEELDVIFTDEMKLPRDPWRSDEEVNRAPGHLQSGALNALQ